MGLGGLAVVTNDEVNRFILAMRLPTFLGRFVHFSDVSLACARRVLAESMAQRGVTFSETPNTHAVAKRWEKLRGGAVTLQSDFGTQHYLGKCEIDERYGKIFRFRFFKCDCFLRLQLLNPLHPRFVFFASAEHLLYRHSRIIR